MKTAILVALFSVLALGAHGAAMSSGSQGTSQIVNAGSALKMYYDAFRSIMPCGYKPMDIPVLAPFTMSNVNVDYSNDYYSINGSFSNVYISGLNSYVFLKYDFDPTTGLLSYDTFIPEIQILAESDIDAWVMIAGYKVKMNGKGLWDVKYDSLRVVGSLVMAPNAQGQMQLSNHKLNVFLGDVHVNNWYEPWNIAANNYYNEWMRSFILMMTQQTQEEVNDLYNSILVPYINKMWGQVTEQQFIDYLVNESAQMSMSGCRA